MTEHQEKVIRIAEWVRERAKAEQRTLFDILLESLSRSEQEIAEAVSKVKCRDELQDIKVYHGPSDVHPRPTEVGQFRLAPFSLSEEGFEQIWQQLRRSKGYEDIQELRGSDGKRYLFSTKYLNPAYARGLVELEILQQEIS